MSVNRNVTAGPVGRPIGARQSSQQPLASVEQKADPGFAAGQGARMSTGSLAVSRLAYFTASLFPPVIAKVYEPVPVIAGPRSNSAQVPVGAGPAGESAVPEIAGALFHVIPVSVQLVFVRR